MPPPLTLSMLTMTATFLSTLLPLQSARTQWQSIGPVGAYEKTGDGVLISAPPAKVRLSVLAPDIIRVRLSRNGDFLPDSSWAVVGNDLGDRSFTFTESASAIEIKTRRLSARIRKSPCRISFYDAAGTLINEDDSSKGMSWVREEVAVWKTMPEDEYYFGFGEKAGGMQRKWKAMSMWNSDIPAYH